MRKPYSSLIRKPPIPKDSPRKPSILRVFVDALSVISVVCAFSAYAIHFYQLSDYFDNPSRIISYDDIISPFSYFILVTLFSSLLVFIAFLYLNLIFSFCFSITLNFNNNNITKIFAIFLLHLAWLQHHF